MHPALKSAVKSALATTTSKNLRLDYDLGTCKIRRRGCQCEIQQIIKHTQKMLFR